MKKMIIFSSVLIVIVLFIFCGILYVKTHKYSLCMETSDEVCKGTLYIYGNEITNENVTIHYRKNYSSYCELPLIEILNGLGCHLKWRDDNTALIVYGEKEYILDLSDISLMEIDSVTDLILPVDGGSLSNPVVLDNELILPDVMICNILDEMGINVYIDFDLSEPKVYITDKSD